jgi:tRNA modification GTPase
MRFLERDRDTICALATAHGLGAISVVRISGPQAVRITRKLAAFLPKKLKSHKIYYGIVRAPDSSRSLDEVLIAYFAEGRSFTGEATLEISCHGSQTVVSEILEALVSCGARPAERGEFTYRAFMSGRIDLVQAESVLSLIESRSTRAAQLALRQLQGDLSKRLKEITDGLTWVLAHLEANIDFASEDIEIVSPRRLAEHVQSHQREVARMVASYHQGRIVTNGFHVALVGAPNAGKSSLLNALAGEERAIVTPVPGTTRDFVEAVISETGFVISIIDTAGLRVTDDPVEKIGVQRTLEKLATVDLILYVIDARTGETPDETSFWERLPWNKSAFVLNKVDLGDGVFVPAKPVLSVLRVSALTGEGIPELRAWLGERLRLEMSEDSTLLSNARHLRGLQLVQEALERALPLLGSDESPDLIALEVQSALKALYEILGMTFDDQVMDRVFAEFCLGK